MVVAAVALEVQDQVVAVDPLVTMVETTHPAVLHTVQVAVVVPVVLVVMVHLLLVVAQGVLEYKFQQFSEIQQDRVLLETLGV